VFEEPRGSFSIDIPAAHSIDDHDAVHDNIPSSRLIVEDVRQKAESSDSDLGGKLEVHKNKPFAHPPRNASPRPRPKCRKAAYAHPASLYRRHRQAPIRPQSPLHTHRISVCTSKSRYRISVQGPPGGFKPGEAAGTPYGRRQHRQARSLAPSPVSSKASARRWSTTRCTPVLRLFPLQMGGRRALIAI
jgi:hypothetical protein